MVETSADDPREFSALMNGLCRVELGEYFPSLVGCAIGAYYEVEQVLGGCVDIVGDVILVVVGVDVVFLSLGTRFWHTNQGKRSSSSLSHCLLLFIGQRSSSVACIAIGWQHYMSCHEKVTCDCESKCNHDDMSDADAHFFTIFGALFFLVMLMLLFAIGIICSVLNLDHDDC